MGDVCYEDGIITILARQPMVPSTKSGDVNTPTGAAEGHTVLLVFMRDLPGDVRSRIVIGQSRTMILVGTGTTAEDLTLSVGALGLLRARNAHNMSVDRKASGGGSLAETAGSVRYQTAMQGLLNELGVAKPVGVDGVGTVPMVSFEISANPVVLP
jgi:hypothetical protein